MKLGQVSLGGHLLRVAKAQPFAKTIIGDNEEETERALRTTANTSLLFKDIDLKKSLAELNQGFYIEPKSSVLCLKNLITFEELMIDEEFLEIKTDIENELSKFGQIKSSKIPRPKNFRDFAVGLGNVYVEYENANFARIARRELADRLFRNRLVEATYHDAKKYSRGDFSSRYQQADPVSKEPIK